MNSKKILLKTPYVNVDGSFGGNQGWFETEKGRGKTLANFGCGLIAASDILLHILGSIDKVRSKDKDYLAEEKCESTPGDVISRTAYDRYINRMYRYFRVSPQLGVSGILLALGMNIYFIKNRKQIKETFGGRLVARWAVLPSRMLDRIKEMLSNDIPVLFSIGPGFFRKNRVILYNRLERDGKIIFKPATKTKDHYVTITGVEEYEKSNVDIYKTGTEKKEKYKDKNIIMLQISSWGKKYYVNYNEYKDYVRKNDNYYFSNILYIKKK